MTIGLKQDYRKRKQSKKCLYRSEGENISYRVQTHLTGLKLFNSERNCNRKVLEVLVFQALWILGQPELCKAGFLKEQKTERRYFLHRASLRSMLTTWTQSSFACSKCWRLPPPPGREMVKGITFIHKGKEKPHPSGYLSPSRLYHPLYLTLVSNFLSSSSSPDVKRKWAVKEREE